jgi:hypothetical protein
MEIPGLGALEFDCQTGWWISDPVAVPVLGGAECSIVLSGYDDDAAKEDFVTAVRNFLSIGPAVLREAAPHIFAYYKLCSNAPGYPRIASPEGVWAHIQPGFEAIIERDAPGAGEVYVSLECHCDWESEHGLQIVFRHGLVVSKTGPFDGRLTNGKGREDVVFLAWK